ncbi:MAG: SAM-dependent methyltransferase [Leeuwenhoekiella sp.]
MKQKRMNSLDRDYWERRYAEENTGWNIGFASPPITTYVDQIFDKSLKILIPGAGNGYEPIYLYNHDFLDIKVLDIAQNPLKSIKNQLPDFPDNKLIQEDFFKHTGKYDLILEQTFFCALLPSQRKAYAKKMHDLLEPNGKLAGLFFNFPLTEKGPPFGGSIIEYKKLFSPYFHLKTLKPCYNSIKQRQGSELFFIFEKLNLDQIK